MYVSELIQNHHHYKKKKKERKKERMLVAFRLFNFTATDISEKS